MLAWCAGNGKHLANNTIRSRRSRVCTFLRFCVRIGEADPALVEALMSRDNPSATCLGCTGSCRAPIRRGISPTSRPTDSSSALAAMVSSDSETSCCSDSAWRACGSLRSSTCERAISDSPTTRLWSHGSGRPTVPAGSCSDTQQSPACIVSWTSTLLSPLSRGDRGHVSRDDEGLEVADPMALQPHRVTDPGEYPLVAWPLWLVRPAVIPTIPSPPPRTLAIVSAASLMRRRAHRLVHRRSVLLVTHTCRMTAPSRRAVPAQDSQKPGLTRVDVNGGERTPADASGRIRTSRAGATHSRSGTLGFEPLAVQVQRGRSGGGHRSTAALALDHAPTRNRDRARRTATRRRHAKTGSLNEGDRVSGRVDPSALFFLHGESVAAPRPAPPS